MFYETGNFDNIADIIVSCSGSSSSSSSCYRNLGWLYPCRLPLRRRSMPVLFFHRGTSYATELLARANADVIGGLTEHRSGAPWLSSRQPIWTGHHDARRMNCGACQRPTVETSSRWSDGRRLPKSGNCRLLSVHVHEHCATAVRCCLSIAQ